MKSTPLLASCVAVSAVLLAAACSSKSDNETRGAAGSGNETGGSGNGGSSGATNGGSAGKASAGGGTSSGGAFGGREGGVASGGTSSKDAGAGGTSGVDASSAGGGPTSCQADLQTDPLNCGRCGKSCFGSDCIDGLCEARLLMDVQFEAYAYNRLAGFVSQGKVYEYEFTTAVTNAADSLVLSTSTTLANPPSEGTLVQDLVVNQGDPGIDSVAFDATYIYEAMEGQTVGAQGQVARKKLDGSEDTGAGTKVFALPPGPPNPDSANGKSNLKWQAIAVGSDGIYLAGTTQINGFSHPAPDTTTIYKMALPLGTDTSKLPTALIAGRGEVVTDLAVFGNATTGQHLFWLEYDRTRPDTDAGPGSDYFAYTAPTTGGTPVLLDDVMTSASAFASDGTYVYWTEINDLGRLVRCPLDHLDAAHVTRVADVSNAQEGIALQGRYVYTMELADPGPVFRIDTATGQKELLGNRSIPPSEKETNVIGVDADFVYMTGLDAKVWRLPNVP
jgi:hypothetical protein